jgi:hypothetical protein
MTASAGSALPHGATAERKLDEFLAKFTPEIAELARAARAKMQAFLPGAYEMVYDNYNFLVVGFGPTDKPSQALFSLALSARRVSLCFLTGAYLDDPKSVLEGDGKLVRRIALESAATLDRPAVRALMRQAVKRSPHAFDAARPGSVVVRAVSAKQRPRR